MKKMHLPVVEQETSGHQASNSTTVYDSPPPRPNRATHFQDDDDEHDDLAQEDEFPTPAVTRRNNLLPTQALDNRSRMTPHASTQTPVAGSSDFSAQEPEGFSMMHHQQLITGPQNVALVPVRWDVAYKSSTTRLEKHTTVGRAVNEKLTKKKFHALNGLEAFERRLFGAAIGRNPKTTEAMAEEQYAIYAAAFCENMGINYEFEQIRSILPSRTTHRQTP